MTNITGEGLLQAALILFSAYLAISQLIVRALESEEDNLGRWVVNILIGVMLALWGLLLQGISRIMGLLTKLNPEISGLSATFEPILDFILLTGILFAQYGVYQIGSDDESHRTVTIDTGIRLFTAGLLFGVFQVISVS